MADSSNKEILLEVRGVSKTFPGVQALSKVSLQLHKGEVLAVIGENGAGKSTLMNIIGGLFAPNFGKVFVSGQEINTYSIANAHKKGIVLIPQELNLAGNLDIATNIFLGREIVHGGALKLIDKKVYVATEKILSKVGLKCSPTTLVDNLSTGQKQLVEIGRALSLESRILILDEPTASLTQKEAECLFDLIADLKQKGVGILYISHRLKDVETVADRLIALRDGKLSGELQHNEINHDAMIKLMVGRELKQFFQHSHNPPQNMQPMLQVKDLMLSVKQKQSINFSLYPGEIVSLSGLMGSGRSELAETLFGIREYLTGEIYLKGKTLKIKKPADAIAEGIVLVPEDRHAQGLVLTAKIKDNIALPSLKHLSTLGIVNFSKEKALAEKMVAALNIRTTDIDKQAGLLSGGNQQKIVLAKWFEPRPNVLIIDEPTRGVDVIAKEEIYKLMDELAKEGTSILMISSDLEEVLGMSDRVLVMHDGYIAGELNGNQISEESIMKLSTGSEQKL